MIERESAKGWQPAREGSAMADCAQRAAAFSVRTPRRLSRAFLSSPLDQASTPRARRSHRVVQDLPFARRGHPPASALVSRGPPFVAPSRRPPAALRGPALLLSRFPRRPGTPLRECRASLSRSSGEPAASETRALSKERLPTQRTRVMNDKKMMQIVGAVQRTEGETRRPGGPRSASPSRTRTAPTTCGSTTCRPASRTPPSSCASSTPKDAAPTE